MDDTFAPMPTPEELARFEAQLQEWKDEIDRLDERTRESQANTQRLKASTRTKIAQLQRLMNIHVATDS